MRKLFLNVQGANVKLEIPENVSVSCQYDPDVCGRFWIQINSEDPNELAIINKSLADQGGGQEQYRNLNRDQKFSFNVDGVNDIEIIFIKNVSSADFY